MPSASRAGSSPGDPIPKVLEAVAKTVVAATRTLHAQVKWNNEWRAGQDLVLCYSSFAHHVGIEFWRGSHLPDPGRLLEGTGKNLRHVKVRSVPEAKAPELVELIRAAVELDRTEPPRKR